MESTKVTPMMQQYLQIKERYRDAILFFRLGDFYEMFFEDAQTASKILDIALTSRNKNEDASVPLCGVPYHSAGNGYGGGSLRCAGKQFPGFHVERRWRLRAGGNRHYHGRISLHPGCGG